MSRAVAFKCISTLTYPITYLSVSVSCFVVFDHGASMNSIIQGSGDIYLGKKHKFSSVRELP
jgi:hypothetical protein